MPARHVAKTPQPVHLSTNQLLKPPDLLHPQSLFAQTVVSHSVLKSVKGSNVLDVTQEFKVPFFERFQLNASLRVEAEARCR